MNAPADIPQPTLASIYDNTDCLIYGIGNVGRQDDGLGWAFVDWLELATPGSAATLTRHYQLQLEDADLISGFRQVLFVDATKDPGVETIDLETPAPRFDLSFTSHAISIPTIMATCQHCFGRMPEVQLLTIRGHEWELQQGLTPRAARNLAAAKNFFNKGDPHHGS